MPDDNAFASCQMQFCSWGCLRAVAERFDSKFRPWPEPGIIEKHLRSSLRGPLPDGSVA